MIQNWLNKMKRSQGNWEKIIGKKLRGATTVPESHVWELLEMELNTQSASAKRKSYKIAAAILLLLLITTNLIVLWPSNTSPIAEFDQFNFPNQSSNNLSSTTNSVAERSIEQSTKTNTFFNSKESFNGKNESSVAFASVKDDKAIWANTITGNHNNLEKESDNNLKGSIEQILDYSNSSINTTTTKLKDDFESINSVVATTNYKHHPGKIANASSVLENGTRLSLSQTDLFAYQQSSNLQKDLQFRAAQNSGFHSFSIHQNSSIDLRIIDLTSILEENEEIVTAESASNVEQQHWLAKTQEELTDWKNLVEASKIDVPNPIEDELLEELIEEAELDKKDPLSIIEEQAKDLYYAKTINKGLHFGLITGFQNNWLSKNSRNSEISRESAQRLFSPGYQVGLNFGYDFAEHFGIMAEFKYSDESARFNNEEKNRIEHLDLKYIEVPIYFKVKHSMPTAKMKPLVFNYIVGIQYRDLRSISSFADGEDKRFGQDYNTSEWGVTAGFDLDYYLSKNLFLTVGTRASVNGDASNFPRINDAAGKGTLNYSVGVYTRFNFRLPGR